MGKYDFDSMGTLWADQARKIVENDVFVSREGNWDLWAYDDTVYSIPVLGSGCGASVWCPLSGLRRHLYHLRAGRVLVFAWAPGGNRKRFFNNALAF